MVVLPMPCSCSCSSSFNRHTNNKNMVCMTNNNNMVRTSSSFATATLTANPPAYPFHKISLIRNTGPRSLVREEDHDHLKVVKIEDEGYLENEAANAIIKRLTLVVERLREVEIQKFMGKVKEGDDSRIAADEMSKEIFSKFLERPIEYLASDDGCLQQKLKDVGVLVGILENSCPAHIKDRSSNPCQACVHSFVED